MKRIYIAIAFVTSILLGSTTFAGDQSLNTMQDASLVMTVWNGGSSQQGKQQHQSESKILTVRYRPPKKKARTRAQYRADREAARIRAQFILRAKIRAAQKRGDSLRVQRLSDRLAAKIRAQFIRQAKQRARKQRALARKKKKQR